VKGVGRWGNLAHNITFQDGDVLITGAGAPMWGYNSELERTMVIGPPSAEQQRLFAHMTAAQVVMMADRSGALTSPCASASGCCACNFGGTGYEPCYRSRSDEDSDRPYYPRLL
jgi:Metallopeptidase family M24